jgi:dihydrofolate reductase
MRPMGRTVYWMNVSMDLRIEHLDGEQGGGSWMRIGEELHREFNRRARALSLMVQARTIYETMEGFWPAARHDESLPDYIREYGEIWTTTPKVLVSHTRTDAPHNTRAIGAAGDAIEQLAKIRAETEGRIGVGGATLASELLRAGLLDELLLFMHPVVLGAGRPLFDGDPAPLQCELLEQKTFERGVVMLRYGLEK